jgi:hypothetical protein
MPSLLPGSRAQTPPDFGRPDEPFLTPPFITPEKQRWLREAAVLKPVRLRADFF